MFAALAGSRIFAQPADTVLTSTLKAVRVLRLSPARMLPVHSRPPR